MLFIEKWSTETNGRPIVRSGLRAVKRNKGGACGTWNGAASPKEAYQEKGVNPTDSEEQDSHRTGCVVELAVVTGPTEAAGSPNYGSGWADMWPM